MCENNTLQELSLKYFEMEQQINNAINKKFEICKDIDTLYDVKRDIYDLIKKKQVEESEIKKNNLIKYGLKVSLNDNVHLESKIPKVGLNFNSNVQLNRDYGLTLSELKNAK
jgi:hypothetical protein